MVGCTGRLPFTWQCPSWSVLILRCRNWSNLDWEPNMPAHLLMTGANDGKRVWVWYACHGFHGLDNLNRRIQESGGQDLQHLAAGSLGTSKNQLSPSIVPLAEGSIERPGSGSTMVNSYCPVFPWFCAQSLQPISTNQKPSPHVWLPSRSWIIKLSSSCKKDQKGISRVHPRESRSWLYAPSFPSQVSGGFHPWPPMLQVSLLSFFAGRLRHYRCGLWSFCGNDDQIWTLT